MSEIIPSNQAICSSNVNLGSDFLLRNLTCNKYDFMTIKRDIIFLSEKSLYFFVFHGNGNMYYFFVRHFIFFRSAFVSNTKEDSIELFSINEHSRQDNWLASKKAKAGGG